MCVVHGKEEGRVTGNSGASECVSAVVLINDVCAGGSQLCAYRNIVGSGLETWGLHLLSGQRKMD